MNINHYYFSFDIFPIFLIGKNQMSTYNKSTDRDTHGRINRKLTKNEVSRSSKYSKLKHLRFVLIQRHTHKQLLQQILNGFTIDAMLFNEHPHKPTKYDCCL